MSPPTMSKPETPYGDTKREHIVYLVGNYKELRPGAKITKLRVLLVAV